MKEKINTGEIDIDQVNKKDELIISKRNCAQIFLKDVVNYCIWKYINIFDNK